MKTLETWALWTKMIRTSGQDWWAHPHAVTSWSSRWVGGPLRSGAVQWCSDFILLCFRWKWNADAVLFLPDPSRPRRQDHRRAVQDVRLRLGDRIQLLGDRVGQRQVGECKPHHPDENLGSTLPVMGADCLLWCRRSMRLLRSRTRTSPKSSAFPQSSCTAPVSPSKTLYRFT